MSNSCKDIIESFRIFNARIYNNILFLMQPSSFWGIWIELITKNIYKTRLKVKEGKETSCISLQELLKEFRSSRRKGTFSSKLISFGEFIVTIFLFNFVHFLSKFSFSSLKNFKPSSKVIT